MANLITRFQNFVANAGELGCTYTLSSFVAKHENEELRQLAAQINPKVFASYAELRRYGTVQSFQSYLVNKCCCQDTLLTSEYQKAISDSERRDLIRDLINNINNVDKGKDKAVMKLVSPSSAKNRRDLFSMDDEYQETKGQVDLITEFYSRYTTTEKPKAVPAQATPTKAQEPQKSNIVVQPPKKPNNVQQEKPSSVVEYLQDLSQGNYSQVPRNKLNDINKHLVDTIKSTTNADKKLYDLYGIANELNHNGFTATTHQDWLTAMKILQQHGLEALPKGERRALADLITRGAEQTLKQLRKLDNSAVQCLEKCATQLKVNADRDVLDLAPKLADLLKSESDETQMYAIGHNAVPILRSLLNGGEFDKIPKYLQLTRLGEAETNGWTLKHKKMTWSSSLSSSKPYESDDGKIKIFASLPYSDNVSMFSAWLGASQPQIKPNSVFLAPTDSTIIGTGFNKKWQNMSTEDKKNWILSHQAKSNAKLVDSVKKNAAGEGEWINQYKTVHGKNVDTHIKTKVINYAKKDAMLVPIYTILS